MSRRRGKEKSKYRRSSTKKRQEDRLYFEKRKGKRLKLTLDFSGVSFMDSSGIAVVMRALKRMRAMGGSAAIKSVPPQAKKVFTAAGIFRIVPLEEGEKSDESKTE